MQSGSSGLQQLSRNAVEAASKGGPGLEKRPSWDEVRTLALLHHREAFSEPGLDWLAESFQAGRNRTVGKKFDYF